ncbi:MAG: hypothetical protein Kow0031_04200 [Anaerolineae bacterium]
METSPKDDTILVIDDTVEALRLLFGVLSTAGYQVLTAENGAAALARLEHAAPDLILLDVMMPDMDGFELYRRLRALPATADTPVIFVSALDSPVAVVKGLELNAADYITKPFKPPELLARVERQLRFQQLQKEIRQKNLRLEQEIAERKNAEEKLKRRNYELALVGHASQVFSANLELSTVIQTVLEEIYDMLEVSGASIWLSDPAENTVTCSYAVGVGHNILAGWRLPLGQGITGRVAGSGQPAVVSDTRHDPRHLKDVDQRIGIEMRSMLSLPLQSKGQTLGVLNVVDAQPGRFSTTDLDLFGPIGVSAAIAIENARLFQQASRANQAKSEFMSTASHELKIPMTSIKGYARLLEMGAAGPLSEKQADFLKIISSNVDRMNMLVSDLLDVSRIEAGRIRLEFTDVALAEVIDDVLSSLESAIKQKGQSLRLDIAADLSDIRADYGRMVQIVTNLLSNAHKYTPAGGQISVSAQPLPGEPGGVLLAVADTGYGISEQDMAQLFTNFFRSADENIRSEPGTGLGLTITKKMIESHGGQLAVQSQPGAGSTFTVTLPLQSEIPPGVEIVNR